jgi:hypothetical protein
MNSKERHTKDCVGFLRDYRRASAWLSGAWYLQGAREWNSQAASPNDPNRSLKDAATGFHIPLRKDTPPLVRARPSTPIVRFSIDTVKKIALEPVVFVGYAGHF